MVFEEAEKPKSKSNWRTWSDWTKSKEPQGIEITDFTNIGKSVEKKYLSPIEKPKFMHEEQT